MPDPQPPGDSSFSFSFPPLPGDVRSILDQPLNADEMGRLGPYRVLQVLGEGGMGMVFVAEDAQRQRIALKVMRPALASHQSARQRFLREARAASLVKHPHIISLHDVGEAKGVPYLAMPLLEGESLHVRLHRSAGPLPLGEAVTIARQMAEGLAAAHAASLIHRDIKPANIWLEGCPTSPDLSSPVGVKLLDFGLVRMANEESNLTGTGTVLGTPSYMAPEQARALKVDARADLFSLGCILYEMTTGVRAFPGDQPMQVLFRLATEEPPPPRERNPQIPSALAQLILRLLAKKPDARPATARMVADELTALAADPALLEAPLPLAMSLESTALPDNSTWATLSSPRPGTEKGRRRAWIIAGVTILVIAAGIVLALIWNRGAP
jgi:serine/threonine protein kinase